MNIFKGPVLDKFSGKYDIVRTSFNDGISRDNIPSFGTSVVSGAYPKAVGTQESGYMTKQLIATFQADVLDEHGTDCKSDFTVDIVITEKNAKNLKYRYIVENGSYVCLDDNTIGKYIGKQVKLRTPMGCRTQRICNICAGEFDYKRGNKNIGLSVMKLSTTLQRLGMKEFHIAKIQSHEINLNDIFL